MCYLKYMDEKNIIYQNYKFFLEALFKTDEGSFIDKASEKKYL